MKKLFPVFLACLGVMVGLTSCGKKKDNPKDDPDNTKYEVKFYEDDECKKQYGETVLVESGKKVARPATDPVKAEDSTATYTFKEWVDYDTLETYNFDNPVTKNLKIFADFETHIKEANLYVYIWQGDADLVITDAEAAAIEEKVKAIEPSAVVVKYKGISVNEFCGNVNNSGKADVVIGGATINPKDTSKYPERTAFVTTIPTTDTEVDGKLAKFAEGWVADTARYVGICNPASNAHIAKAKAVYDALLTEGPYKATLSSLAVSLTTGETATVEVTAKPGVTVTWGTEDATIATVANGVITPVAVGETKVYAMVGAIKYEVTVSVIAKREPFTINVAMYKRVYANVETLKAEYAKVADPLCTVNWITNDYEKVATFSEAVDKYAKDNSTQIDLVAAHTQVTSGHENGLKNPATYNYDFGQRELMDSTWSTAGDTNYYAATNILTTGQAATECGKIIAILKAANPDVFTLTETSCSIEVGTTATIQTSVAGVTFVSKDPTVATVDAAGVVTAVKAGSTVIECTIGHNTKEFAVTVFEGKLVQTYDLYVYINTTNKADASSNVWMTEEDAQKLIDAFKAEGQPGFGKNIKLVCGRDTGWAILNETVLDSKDTVEEINVLIARDASWTVDKLLKEGNFPVLAGTEVTPVHASWNYNTGSAAISSWTDEEQQDLAKAFLAFVKDGIPNYFELAEITGSIMAGKTVTIVPSVQGVTFTSKNTEIATVTDAGVVTGVAAGTTEIECVLGTYKVNFVIEVVADTTPNNDLLVWINLRPDQNWMSQEDKAILEAQLKALDPTKTITLVVREETKVADVQAAAAAQGVKDRVDILIGRDALQKLYTDGEVVNVFEASWGFKVGYVITMKDVIDEHKELVALAVEMLQKDRNIVIYGDDYFTLTETSSSIKVGETATIVASKTGVTFSSSDATIATVDASGVVTAVAVGNATITCTKGTYSTTYAVTVLAAEAQPYTINVVVNPKVAQLEALKTEYAKVADANCTVNWVVIEGSKVAAFSEAVDAYAKDNSIQWDLVIAHTQVTSGHENGLAYASTYNYSFQETRYQLDASWVDGTTTNYYAAINSLTTGNASAECAKIGAILALAMPA